MKEEAKQRPILFSTPMVQAILDGRKNQTRRIIKSKHESGLFQVSKNHEGQVTEITSLDWDERPKNDTTGDIRPIVNVGDVLWVRETWQYSDDLEEPYLYKQKYLDDYKPEFHDLMKWKSSTHMPYEACRIFLKVTNVRVESLQDISEEDAIKEGINNYLYGKDTPPAYENYLVKKKDFKEDGWAHVADNAIDSFKSLWESINGKESWDANPFVWVYDFERTEKP